MQAHAPKHRSGSVAYLERHLLPTLLILGVLVVGVLAAIAVLIEADDAATVAVPAVVAPAPATDFRTMEQNTELPSAAGDVQVGMKASRLGATENRAVDPVEWQRFVDENTHMPDYAVEPPRTVPMSIGEMWMLEQNLYLPGDAVEPQRDANAPRPALGDHTDIKAHFEAEMGEGWLDNGNARAGSGATEIPIIDSRFLEHR